MPDLSLNGLRILVVEDEYFLAEDLQRSLTQAGATVAGPVAHVDDALQLIENGDKLAAAVLDVNLAGDRVYPVAEKLEARGVPFVFATGYNERDLPARWKHVARLEKGIQDDLLVSTLARMVATSGGTGVRRD